MSATEVAGQSPSAQVLWGLRHYGSLIAVAGLGLGIGAPAVQSLQPPVYEAEALVVATQLELSSETLPRYAEAVFDSGSVARDVASDPRIDIAVESLIPDSVDVVTALDSVALVVVGHDPDPQTAVVLANQAARAFVMELNRPGPGVGTFAIQDLADVPEEPTSDLLSTPVGAAVGAITGIIFGVGLVALLIAVRRPVVSAEDVASLGLPVLGFVQLPRVRKRQFFSPRGIPGIGAVARRVLEAGPDVVLIASPRRAAPARQRISVMLAMMLNRSTSPDRLYPPELAAAVEASHAGRGDASVWSHTTSTRPRPVVIVDDADPLDVLHLQDRNAWTLLVVPQGTSRR